MDTFYTADLKAKLKAKIPLLLIIFVKQKFQALLIIFGAILIFLALGILILTFYPVIKTEVIFEVSSRSNSNQEIIPVDTNFGIVIPKIKANAKVIPNVNPYNEREYQVALTKGVAQAKGTSLPGQTGNVFIFSHSAADFFEATKYNSIFYLLSKLEKGDEVDLYYKGEKFVYKVTEKVMADPADLSYLTKKTSQKTVTLMTCWPPGTTFKRLIIIANYDNIKS